MSDVKLSSPTSLAPPAQEPPRSAEQKIAEIRDVLKAAPDRSADAKPEGADANNKADVSPIAGSPGDKTPDPIQTLVTRLQAATAALPAGETGLTRGIAQLGERAASGDIAADPLFRTHVAYALQDTQRVLGRGAVEIPREVATEMETLAGSSPGLTNPSMREMLQGTAQLGDRALVRDLRRAAASLATTGDNQNGPSVGPIIAAFENRVRLSPKASEPLQTNKIMATPETEQTARPSSPQPQPTTSQLDQGSREVRAEASPGDWQTPSTEGTTQATAKPAQPERKRVISHVMDGLSRGAAAAGHAPWAPPGVSMTERMSALGQRLDAGRTDRLIRSAEASGTAYMDAIERFSVGPGADILAKIDVAATTEPGGLPGVMQQMQPGGRYANLRTEFDDALQRDKVFAAAYSQLERTGSQYGKDRLAVTTDFDARKLDMKQLDARFAKAEEMISDWTERIPGRSPGTNAAEDLGQKVVELLKRAAGKVRSMFKQEARQEQRADTSPSPSP